MTEYNESFRYAIYLSIDNRKPIWIGSFRNKKGAEKEVIRLKDYAGYSLEIKDLKPDETGAYFKDYLKHIGG